MAVENVEVGLIFLLERQFVFLAVFVGVGIGVGKFDFVCAAAEKELEG